jgi:hypothetical protein
VREHFDCAKRDLALSLAFIQFLLHFLKCSVELQNLDRRDYDILLYRGRVVGDFQIWKQVQGFAHLAFTGNTSFAPNRPNETHVIVFVLREGITTNL